MTSVTNWLYAILHCRRDKVFKVYSKEAECRAIIVKFNPQGLKDEYIDNVSCVLEY